MFNRFLHGNGNPVPRPSGQAAPDASLATHQNATKYYADVYVEPTGDGPGHVGLQLVKEANGRAETREVLSYMPGSTLGAIVNASSSVVLLPIPVPAALETRQEFDEWVANGKVRSYRREITREQFSSALHTQKELEHSTKSGNTMYSVWKSLDSQLPNVEILPQLANSFVAAMNEKMPRSQNNPVPLRQHNCVSSVGHVLSRAGIASPSLLFSPKHVNDAFMQDKEWKLQNKPK